MKNYKDINSIIWIVIVMWYRFFASDFNDIIDLGDTDSSDYVYNEEIVKYNQVFVEGQYIAMKYWK
jgi:hypothetical protein